MTALDFVHELALAIESDTLDVKQRLAEQINNRWGAEFRQVAEEMPEADLPIAGDWLEDRGFVVAGRILRTWRGLDEAIEGSPKPPPAGLAFWSANRHQCYMLTATGFRYSCSTRKPAGRWWVRGGFKSVPLICVDAIPQRLIQWQSYDVANALNQWPSVDTGDMLTGSLIDPHTTAFGNSALWQENCRRILDYLHDRWDWRKTGLAASL